MKLRFVVLADRVEEIAGTGGKINVYGAGITHLVLPELPAVGPNIALVCSLELEEDDFDREHTIYATVRRREDGHELRGLPVELEAERFQRRDDAESQSSTVVINFAGLLFERHGAYDFGLVVDDDEVGSAPFVVRPTLALPNAG